MKTETPTSAELRARISELEQSVAASADRLAAAQTAYDAALREWVKASGSPASNAGPIIRSPIRATFREVPCAPDSPALAAATEALREARVGHDRATAALVMARDMLTEAVARERSEFEATERAIAAQAAEAIEALAHEADALFAKFAAKLSEAAKRETAARHRLERELGRPGSGGSAVVAESYYDLAGFLRSVKTGNPFDVPKVADRASAATRRIREAAGV